MISKNYFAVVILLLLFNSCKKSEDVRPSNAFMMNEDSNKGQVNITLNWTLNGIEDNGMLADMSIYLTPGNYDDLSLSGPSKVSSIDYIGGETVSPSYDFDLRDFYRYYIGVCYNGTLTPNAAITFPLIIDYTITVEFDNTTSERRVITGSLIIESSEKLMTKIEYPYLMDINDSEATDEYRSYSFREIPNPLSVLRSSDVTSSFTFESNKTLTIEGMWSVNGNMQGYKYIDLDLLLVDTLVNPVSYTDLFEYSNNAYAFEKLFVSPNDADFNDGDSKQLGFFYDADLGAPNPTSVQLMLKLNSFGSTTINRKITYVTLNIDLATPGDGNMYLLGNIKKSGNEYIFELNSSLVIY